MSAPVRGTVYLPATIEHRDGDDWFVAWVGTFTEEHWRTMAQQSRHPLNAEAVAVVTFIDAPRQPEEPTGLGAVVDVPEFAPCTPSARERFTLTVESSHNQRPWVLEGDVEIRQTWAQLVNSGPVTVLSEGVTS